MIAVGRANARTMCSFRKRPRNLLTADFFNKHPLSIHGAAAVAYTQSFGLVLHPWLDGCIIAEVPVKFNRLTGEDVWRVICGILAKRERFL